MMRLNGGKERWERERTTERERGIHTLCDTCRAFFAAHATRLARKLSWPGALFIIALNQRAAKAEGMQPSPARLLARVPFFHLCPSVRLSACPPSFPRASPTAVAVASRRAAPRCISPSPAPPPLNRPGNCALNISGLFPRRERAAQRATPRFSERLAGWTGRGRGAGEEREGSCPPPFIRSSFILRSAVCLTTRRPKAAVQPPLAHA